MYISNQIMLPFNCSWCRCKWPNIWTNEYRDCIAFFICTTGGDWCSVWSSCARNWGTWIVFTKHNNRLGDLMVINYLICTSIENYLPRTNLSFEMCLCEGWKSLHLISNLFRLVQDHQFHMWNFLVQIHPVQLLFSIYLFRNFVFFIYFIFTDLKMMKMV